jgi:hypothetical protein
MPRGGFRPGGGARKGNANALKNGANSKRLQKLLIVFRSHPNVREIYRIGLIQGVIFPAPQPPDLAKLVEVLYPAVFDRNHPWFNQINQRPEAGYPTPWPGPRLKKEELREI